MKVDAIRALSSADLNAQLLALKEEQMRLRFQLATNQVTSHATIRTAKKRHRPDLYGPARARDGGSVRANARVRQAAKGKTERW